MSHQVFGFGEFLGLARLAARENAQSSRRYALADFGWDASSLIECRISVAANKGFFGSAFVDTTDTETSTLRSVQ